MLVIIDILLLFGCFEDFNTSKRYLYIYFKNVPNSIDKLNKNDDNYFNDLTNIVVTLSKQIAKG